MSTTEPSRSSRRSPYRLPHLRAAAKKLGVSYGRYWDPSSDAVVRLASIELQRQQTRSAARDLATLGSHLFKQAQAPDLSIAIKADLLTQSQAAWRFSRTLRMCTASLTTNYLVTEERLVVRHTMACKHRLCPHCARWRARALHRELTVAVATLRAANPNAKFVLLTLTKPNCAPAELAASLRALSRNVRKLLAKPELKRMVEGYVAVTEVTFNHADHTFHDHVHLLVQVDGAYGPQNSDLWLTQKRLVALWSGIYQTDRRLVVDVRFVRANDDDELRQSLAELGTYLSSPLSLMTRDESRSTGWATHAAAMMTLANATHHQRLIAYGGSLKRARLAARAPANLAVSA